jgi:ribosomal protein S18 acetylase RimI-like enzyme
MSPRLEGLAIRSMSVHDLADVMGIERHSQNSASSDDNFKSEMRNGFTHAFVAHDEHRILGYLVFWLVHDEAYLLNLAVHTRISGDSVLDRGSWPF